MYVNVHTLLYIYCIITTTVYVQHPWPYVRLSPDLQTDTAGVQELLRSAWLFLKEHVFHRRVFTGMFL